MEANIQNIHQALLDQKEHNKLFNDISRCDNLVTPPTFKEMFGYEIFINGGNGNFELVGERFKESTNPYFIQTYLLTTALKNLVEVKAYKDEYGKDGKYATMRIKAWELANNVLESFGDKQTSLPKGFPTNTKDINGNVICLGDIIDYDFEDSDTDRCEVVFEDNAFRKKYANWNNNLTKTILEYGISAEKMRLKIIK